MVRRVQRGAKLRRAPLRRDGAHGMIDRSPPIAPRPGPVVTTPLDPAAEHVPARPDRPDRVRAAAPGDERAAGPVVGRLPVPPEPLRAVDLLADLPHDELAWLAAQGELVELEAGELLFRPGDPAVWMFVPLDGVLQARRDQLGPNAPAYVFRVGDVGGTVPFSRMHTFEATGRAVTRAAVARFARDRFDAILDRIPVLRERFVWHLLDRVRDATRRDAQFEKLMALGKLSAGLAHELNNPTSAVRQALGESTRRLAERGRLTAALADARLDGDAVRRLERLRAEARERPAAAADDGDADATLRRSDRHDAVAEWLAAAGVSEPWMRAATFVDAGVDAGALAAALAGLAPAACAPALAWLEAGIAGDALVRSAEAATDRMVRLVELMRAYTNRDLMREMADVDLRDGLATTLALVEPKARERRVSLAVRHADGLPRVRAYPGDLNQAWSALLDNAVDAAPAGRGRVEVRTAVREGAIVVEIRDDGPGIPPTLADRVWEPFFTTKDVGHGTGLGLDVARRVIVDLHGGALDFTSAPGGTCFSARLPLSSAGTFGA